MSDLMMQVKIRHCKRTVMMKVWGYSLSLLAPVHHNTTEELNKNAVLYGRVRPMLNGARVPIKAIRDGVLDRDGAVCCRVEKYFFLVTPSMQTHLGRLAVFFYNTKMPVMKSVREFGEMAVVEDNKSRKIREIG
jgi:hypothetical protein